MRAIEPAIRINICQVRFSVEPPDGKVELGHKQGSLPPEKRSREYWAEPAGDPAFDGANLALKEKFINKHHI